MAWDPTKEKILGKSEKTFEDGKNGFTLTKFSYDGKPAKLKVQTFYISKDGEKKMAYGYVNLTEDCFKPLGTALLKLSEDFSIMDQNVDNNNEDAD